MLLRRSASRGASDTFSGADGSRGVDRHPPRKLRWSAPDSDLPIPNCPDMKTCAAVASWDLSCWPRGFCWASAVLRAGARGNYMHLDSKSPWQSGVPEMFIPSIR